jgi:hypothetical protein
MNSVQFFDESGQQTLLDQQMLSPQQSLRRLGEIERHSSDETEEYDDESDTTQNSIPITVCLPLVISYICSGVWFDNSKKFMSELIDGNIKFSDAYIGLLIVCGHEFCFVEICQLMNHFISYITRKLIICLTIALINKYNIEIYYYIYITLKYIL